MVGHDEFVLWAERSVPNSVRCYVAGYDALKIGDRYAIIGNAYNIDAIRKTLKDAGVKKNLMAILYEKGGVSPFTQKMKRDYPTCPTVVIHYHTGEISYHNGGIPEFNPATTKDGGDCAECSFVRFPCYVHVWNDPKPIPVIGASTESESA